MLKLLCLCSHILLKANCPHCVEAFINCLVSLVQKPLIGSFLFALDFVPVGRNPPNATHSWAKLMYEYEYDQKRKTKGTKFDR